MDATTDSETTYTDLADDSEEAAPTTVVIAVMADATIPGRVRKRLSEADAEFVAVRKYPAAVVGRFEVASVDDPVVNDLLAIAAELWHDPNVGGPAVVADPRLGVSIGLPDDDGDPVDEAVSLCLEAGPGEVLLAKGLVGRDGATTDVVYRDRDGSVHTFDRLVTVEEKTSEPLPDAPMRDFDGSALRELQHLGELAAAIEAGEAVQADAPVMVADDAGGSPEAEAADVGDVEVTEPAGTATTEPPPHLPPAREHVSDRGERLEEIRKEVRGILDASIETAASKMVVITGAPRTGKTSLAISVIEDAPQTVGTIIRVRCGEDERTRTWPVAQIVEQALGLSAEDPADKLTDAVEGCFAGADDGDVAARWVSGILGLEGSVSNGDRIGWTLRRLLTTVGRQGPILLAIDDVDHASADLWFLLLEVVERIRDTSLFVLCTAQGAPMPVLDAPGVTSVECPTPTLDDIAHEMQQQIDDPALTDPVLDAYAELADGDLGLVPSLVRSATEVLGDGSGVPTVPTDIASVVASDLHTLSDPEQAVLGLSAGIDDPFAADLLAVIVPDGISATVSDILQQLAEKGYLRQDFEGRPGALDFANRAVRSVATDVISDETRADVHEHCARWRDERALSRPRRFAEEIGIHLLAAQDFRNRASGQVTATGGLGSRAADMLAMAADRALDLGDSESAIRLCASASTFLDHGDPRRSENLMRSALVLAKRNDLEATSAAQQALASAKTSGAIGIEQRAKVLEARVDVAGSNAFETLEKARASADQAIRVLEPLGDNVGCAEAYLLRAAIAAARGNFGACTDAASLAAFHAHHAAAWSEEVVALTTLAAAAAEGPLPIPEAVAVCSDAAQRLRDDMNTRQDVEGRLAVLLARQGRIVEARQATARVAATFNDIGIPDSVATGYLRAGQVEMLAGDDDVAVQYLRAALEAAVSPAISGAIAATLAHALLFTGAWEEALTFTELAESSVRSGDLITPVLWRMARAKALAMGGRNTEADIIGRHGLRLAEQTDSAILRAEALLDLAQVLASSDRSDEAFPLATKAQRIFERKGAFAQSAAAKTWIDSLTGASASVSGGGVIPTVGPDEGEAAPAGHVRNPDAYEI